MKGTESEVDLNEFSYAPTEREVEDVQSRQVPWLEETMESGDAFTRIAFYIHSVELCGRFYYGEQEVPLPEATPMPRDLGLSEYESP